MEKGEKDGVVFGVGNVGQRPEWGVNIMYRRRCVIWIRGCTHEERRR